MKIERITKVAVNKCSFFAYFFTIFTFFASAQVYGPEKVLQGNFGTVDSRGKNGDNGVGENIYPLLDATKLGTYYQPAHTVFNNNILKEVPINPNATFGKPLTEVDGAKTSYKWGLTETWYSGYANTLPDKSNKNSWQIVPHAPNNGYYIIATSTSGMYHLPSLSDKPWPITLYDRYETDLQNPRNYFMVVNADEDSKKVFYSQEVQVESGQAYRMGLDLAQLNNTGAAPSVALVIDSDPTKLSTAKAIKTITMSKVGVWENTYFDYVVPCGVKKVYIAFRNNVSGGVGNDLALDNLSMKAIIPQIKTSMSNCSKGTYTLTVSTPEAFPAASYTFQWQIKNGNTYKDVSGATQNFYTANAAGVYRLSVYTKTTGECRMYSNEIALTKVDNCLVVVNPVARDDVYTTLPATNLEGNVLTNDAPGNVGDALAVVEYEINGTKYAAGTTAKIYKDNVLVGTITLNQNGTFLFISVPGLNMPFTVPDITYVIAENTAGQASAKIKITVKEKAVPVIAVKYDASCTLCSIKVSLSGTNMSDGINYSLYRGTEKKGTFDVNYKLEFVETVSGTFEYTVKDEKGGVVKTFSMTVHPAAVTWKKASTTTLWSDSANWESPTGTGSPIWCTDVTIAENAATYPTLVAGDACRDITFKNGATVGQIQQLLYRKAFVELNPERNRWYMLSDPLRYMYSADYHGDMTWTNAESPKIFMMYFNVASSKNPDGRTGYSVGDFSKPFAKLEEDLRTGKGFALWVNGKANGFSYNDTSFPTGTPYKFPRRLANGNDVSYSYHDKTTGKWLTPVSNLDRGDVASIPNDSVWSVSHDKLSAQQKNNRYRFLFEESFSNGASTVAVAAGTTNIVGNPFMSHIDFAKFVEDNANNIYGYYRIWDGNKFYAYVAAGSSEMWSGLGGLSTETSVEGLSQFIPPMQSFFVETKPGKSSIVFKPQNISVAKTGVNVELRSQIQAISDVIYISLTMNNTQSQTILAARKGASLRYAAGEDIKKLFSPGTDIPEIYTIADETEALEINLIGNDDKNTIIPIGIRTGKTGTATITIKGIETFTAYSDVILIDKQQKKEYDLRKTSSVSFDKTSGKNLEDRFTIELRRRSTTGIEKETSEGDEISMTLTNGIQIESAHSELEQVELFDTMGRVVFRKDKIHDNTYLINEGVVGKGFYLLKAKTTEASKSFKLVL
ncbi:putative secreted protein (Por secretion system target) [Dysgonomonas alginatilytica]|uniref:Putative secreted protein (Por secretion system target) n=1 Tax=Dysgonomonas alginatilytica TaxID=1605892 RepID=A0A2V3PQF4_9BACT|nr:T9SS type A sorting domain-containing protein [Dysgonomonas alginatilytica]PXV63351.1 putative secreted protein (Por secretion system target) [Dysgonomonas alginatilytica]